ncbi:hypothetical protein AMAG_03101 [Allomyces macrogynus ATCC 38327]|uniref:Ras-GEF domain-containing protein n=1 Tax=Allomyces macrogynus (strain ATCC 38327) TaxID=578462 RepID=A0A0L0S4S0_ALLM3|nr:hypothetical protein AMAG_03101 [Allomyces macrogynus ATCC 38327]|eukprot:KNE57379.1 hypothetical protein AMAG_03101 [Allomyces macrogynus ATCC 38327]
MSPAAAAAASAAPPPPLPRLAVSTLPPALPPAPTSAFSSTTASPATPAGAPQALPLHLRFPPPLLARAHSDSAWPSVAHEPPYLARSRSASVATDSASTDGLSGFDLLAERVNSLDGDPATAAALAAAHLAAAAAANSPATTTTTPWPTTASTAPLPRSRHPHRNARVCSDQWQLDAAAMAAVAGTGSAPDSRPESLVSPSYGAPLRADHAESGYMSFTGLPSTCRPAYGTLASTDDDDDDGELDVDVDVEVDDEFTLPPPLRPRHGSDSGIDGRTSSHCSSSHTSPMAAHGAMLLPGPASADPDHFSSPASATPLNAFPTATALASRPVSTASTLLTTLAPPPALLTADEIAALPPGDCGLPDARHPFWTDAALFDTPSTFDPAVESKAMATPVALVAYLTEAGDGAFMREFFLVYRKFCSPLQLAKLLRLRFLWYLDQCDRVGEAKVERVRDGVASVIAYWVDEFYILDFAPSRDLRTFLIAEFLNAVKDDPRVVDHARDRRTIRSLRKRVRTADSTFKDLRAAYERALPPSVSASMDLAAWTHLLRLAVFYKAVRDDLDRRLAQDGSGTAPASPAPDALTAAISTTPRSFRASNPAVAMFALAQSVIASTTQKRSSSSSARTRDSALVPDMDGGHESSALAPHAALFAHSAPDLIARMLATKKSLVLTYKPDVLAHQLTLIEEWYLMAIPWHELLTSAGTARAGARTNPVQAMIARHNDTTAWVQTEVCSQMSLDDRVKTVERLIRIAAKCLALGNFSTLQQIGIGLQQSSVDRLKATWKKVSSQDKATFDHLKQVLSLDRNSSALRAAIADRLKSHPGTVIPPLPLYCADFEKLRAVWAGRSTTNLNLPNVPVPIAIPVVPWGKFRPAAAQLTQFLEAQRRPAPVPRPDIPVEVFVGCYYLRTEKPDEIARMSHECEKK